MAFKVRDQVTFTSDFPLTGGGKVESGSPGMISFVYGNGTYDVQVLGGSRTIAGGVPDGILS